MRVPSNARLRTDSAADSRSSDGPKKVGRSPKARPAGGRSDSSVGTADGGASVVLSQRAARLVGKEAEQLGARSERLAQVKAEFQAGSYRIDFEQLTERLAAEDGEAVGL